MKHPFDADVFIDIGPVYSLTSTDKTKLRALLWSRFRESPRPGEWHTDHSTVNQIGDNLVIGDPNALNARLAVSH